MSDFDDKTLRRGGRPEQSPPDESDRAWEATVHKDILVGQQIGEYVVRRRIGSGGMGVVYEGEHPVIGRKVAIKLIRPDSSEGIRSRDLASEARATSAIRHRGIIDIFGFGSLPGIGQYLVMEYLNGRPLDELLYDRAPLLPVEALQLITEVLAALSAAHGVGVIHRDLKPGNIFVVQETQGTEYVKVLDFGLAKQAAAPNAATPQTRASMIVGTPEYMAPEQACGQAVSPRTDLYAVGIILFEMLTGRLPFQGNSPMQVAIQQVNAQPPSPSSFVDGLPPALDALILRLLAKDPEERPASAEVVARELKSISRTLATEGTQRVGLPRGSPEPAPMAASRAPVRQGLAKAAPGRGVTGPRSATEPPAAETRALPRTLTDSHEELPAPPAARVRAAPARAAQAAETDRIERPSGGGSRTPWLVGGGVLAVLLGVGLVLLFQQPEQPVSDVPARGPVPLEPAAAAQGGPPTSPSVPPVPSGPPPSAQTVAQAGDKGQQGAQAPSDEGDPPSAVEPKATAGGTLIVTSVCHTNVFVDRMFKGRVSPGRGLRLPLPEGNHTLVLKPVDAGSVIKSPQTGFRLQAGQTFNYSANCEFD